MIYSAALVSRTLPPISISPLFLWKFSTLHPSQHDIRRYIKERGGYLILFWSGGNVSIESGWRELKKKHKTKCWYRAALSYISNQLMRRPYRFWRQKIKIHTHTGSIGMRKKKPLTIITKVYRGGCAVLCLVKPNALAVLPVFAACLLAPDVPFLFSAVQEIPLQKPPRSSS